MKELWTVPMADRLEQLRLMPNDHLHGADASRAWEYQCDLWSQIKRQRGEYRITNADEVAEYVWAVDPREFWSDDDLDCLIPPFSATWLEYRRPSQINSEGTILKPNNNSPKRTAIIVEMRSVADVIARAGKVVMDEEQMRRSTWQFHNQVQSLLKNKGHILELVKSTRKAKGDWFSLGENERENILLIKTYLQCQEAKSWKPFEQILQRNFEAPAAAFAARKVKWNLHCMGLMEFPGNIVVLLPIQAQVLLNDQGQQIGSLRPFHWGAEPPVGAAIDFDQTRQHSELMLFYRVALIAITMSHCKNVILHKSEPPSKLAKAWGGKGRLSTVHTIKIPQLGHLFDGQGRLRHSAAEREVALHRVRAHYKVYTEDKPLFGHIVGRYLWLSHLRGKGESVREASYEMGLPPLGRISPDIIRASSRDDLKEPYQR